jgi:hypothetical protein
VSGSARPGASPGEGTPLQTARRWGSSNGKYIDLLRLLISPSTG